MKTTFYIAAFVAIIALVIASVNHIPYQRGYVDGFIDGEAMERPLERVMRQYNCIPESEIPEFYPYMRINDLTIIVVADSQGQEMPVKVCPEALTEVKK